MKTHCLLALATATCVVHAGTPAESVASPSIAPAAPEPWIKPTLDIRARYEYGRIDSPALQSSTAITVRERVGLITKDWHGFSALVEGEFLQAIQDNYAVNTNQPNVTPFNPGRTFIADPETNELNQAYLQYKGFDTTIRAGRQRIKINNDAFVGNVGWRQNEQTYDAISISNQSIKDLTLFYAYANRANRIFGSDAFGGLRNFAGDLHFFNASYTGLGDATLKAYAFLMDFDETDPNPGALNFISNNTYGFIATAPVGPVTLYGELAYQTDTSSNSPTRPDEAYYAHLNATTKLGTHAFTLGWEYLDNGFVTPLATVHAFNGFADVFAGPRIGLGGAPHPGISDIYIKHSTPLPFWGLKFTQFFHLFGDNNSDFDYGWEYDAVLAKKFNDNFLAIAKFAYYDSKGPAVAPAVNIAPFNATRFTIELNYKF